MFSLDIFFDQLIGLILLKKTIIPLALIASESIAYSAFSLMDYWLMAHSGSRNNWRALGKNVLTDILRFFSFVLKSGWLFARDQTLLRK